MISKEVKLNGQIVLITIDDNNNMSIANIDRLYGKNCVSYFCGNKKYRIEWRSDRKPQHLKPYIASVDTKKEAQRIMDAIDFASK